MKTTTAEKLWLDQWEAAGPALAEQRAGELAAMSALEALVATEALFEIGAELPLRAERREGSGLVEQQALFHGPAAQMNRIHAAALESPATILDDDAPSILEIPALGDIGRLALVGLLGAAGVLLARRRRGGLSAPVVLFDSPEAAARAAARRTAQ